MSFASVPVLSRYTMYLAQSPGRWYMCILAKDFKNARMPHLLTTGDLRVDALLAEDQVDIEPNLEPI